VVVIALVLFVATVCVWLAAKPAITDERVYRELLKAGCMRAEDCPDPLDHYDRFTGQWIEHRCGATLLAWEHENFRDRDLDCLYSGGTAKSCKVKCP